MNIFYTALTILLPLGLAAVSPQAPKSIILAPDVIISIEVNSRADTVLVFPEEVTHIFGNGITDGKRPGAVHVQLMDNGKILVLQPLQDDYLVFPKLVTESGSYVLELLPSMEPCTLVEFKKSGEAKSGRDLRLTRLELEKQIRSPSRERQMELIRLSREDFIHLDQLPHLYDGYESKSIHAVNTITGFEFTLKKVSRFRKDNCLIVHGFAVNNQTVSALFPVNSARLRIGDSDGLTASQAFVDKAYLKPGERTEFALLLSPTTKLNPGHVSFSNNFELTFNSSLR